MELAERCEARSANCDCCRERLACNKKCDSTLPGSRTGDTEGFLCSFKDGRLFSTSCVCARHKSSSGWSLGVGNRRNAAGKQQVPGALLLLGSAVLAAAPLAGLL
jgi:hypothetical protein